MIGVRRGNSSGFFRILNTPFTISSEPCSTARRGVPHPYNESAHSLCDYARFHYLDSEALRWGVAAIPYGCEPAPRAVCVR